MVERQQDEVRGVAYQANPDVSCGEEVDGAVLYNPDTDGTVILNPAGRALWAFMAAPRTVEQMAALLAATYRDVTSAQATEDVTRFVRSLTPDFLREAGDGDL